VAIFANFKVNWGEKVTERFSFKTNIFSSGSGREVREARRIAPDWQITFTTVFLRDDHRKLASLMTGFREEEVIFPVPTVHCRTTGFWNLGHDFVRLTEDVRPAWIDVDEFVMIDDRFYRVDRLGPNGFWVERIDGGAEDSVFPGPPDRTADTPPGTKITFATWGRFSSQLDVEFQTSRVGTCEITLHPRPRGAVPYAASEHEFARYSAIDRFDFRVNWADTVETRYDQQREEYRAETGPVSYFWKAVPTARYWTTPHTAKTLAEARRMIAFFVAQRGRAKTFFYPAVASELRPNNGIEKNASEIPLVGEDLAIEAEFNLSPQFLLIETLERKQYFRVLTGVYRQHGHTVAQLQAPIPEALKMREMPSIRALYQSRFADDMLEVEWLTDTVAQIEMKVRSIDYVEGEVALLTSENDFGIITESSGSPEHLTTQEGGGNGF
jgi:hypothetical protein